MRYIKIKKLVLKKGKDVPIRNFHHWIFSGAVERIDTHKNGDILGVYSNSGDLLGHAYINDTTDIAGRMLNFDNTDPITALRKNIVNSIKFRENFFGNNTNCFRLINGEGDAIPGLIVDKYNDVLVLQISTLGMDLLKNIVVEELKNFYKDKIQTIYERSDMPSRKREGIKDFCGYLYGENKKETLVTENNIKMLVDFVDGQKTGLFMDMREMRELIGSLSKNKSVLNCFSYTGAYSLYAIKGGAKKVVSVDISKPALEMAKKNFETNGFDSKTNPLYAEDVFNFLRKDNLNYDIVILDPPAFAKKKNDIENAKKAYYEINHTALSKMPSGSLLLSCSCSYHIDMVSFERILAKSAKDAGRKIKLINKHRLAFDHPINLYHQDFDYLKSLLIYIN